MRKLVEIVFLALALIAVVVAMEELRRVQVAREQEKGIAICSLPVQCGCAESSQGSPEWSFRAAKGQS